MGPVINVLVLAVFLCIGLAQHGSIPKTVGYGIGIPLAVVTFILAIVRYRRDKQP